MKQESWAPTARNGSHRHGEGDASHRLLPFDLEWKEFVGLLPPPAPPLRRHRRRAAMTARNHSRNRVLGLAALASDEDGTVDLGSTRRPRAKAAAAETVLWGWQREGEGTPTRSSCSVELWEIIVHGYREPQDPIRLTSTEFYNHQLNASARDKIRSGINRKLLDQVNDIESAKELWDRIVVLQEGTDLIQSVLYETAKQEAHQFMIREGDSMADAYARLGALRVRVKGLGVEK
ncbi:hypothetical protein QYE76_018734 [Lolium multiflorum]|uniref:Uncharacterized protein n=1 Tax=Lolium multiflorum TaxID=4521 RepID=A0AAD8QIG8_LOLMU|nr:hypothetical protein QYE76_018734 [Lolium multiflorum]